MREIAKDKKKRVGIAAVIVAAILALSIGISVYSAPGHQLSRQLALGHKYLENGQYKEAILAFENAITIDEKCTEAYIGGIEAYLLTEDRETLPAFYDKAVAMIENSEKEFLEQHMDDAVEIYLSADQVYAEAPEQAVEVLEKGWSRTEKTEIKDKLIDHYFMIVEKTDEIKDYQEELEVYDRLLELAGSDERVLEALKKCLADYMDFLTDEGKYDEISMLAEKYQDIAAGVDFDVIWVDDLYRKIVAEDADAVFAIMEQPDFIERCEAFPHCEGVVGFNLYSVDYSLLTSNGKIFWASYEEEYETYVICCSPDMNASDFEDRMGEPVEWSREYTYTFSIINGTRNWKKGV